MNEEKPGSQEDTATKARQGNGGRRKVGMVLLLLILLGITAVGWFWYKSKIEVSTDDAFVQAHIHQISARVPGHVVNVPLQDNQKVAAGDLLVLLDDADYRARVASAAAQVEIARNETSGDYAQISAAEAALQQAEARRLQANLDLARGEALFAREVIPRERLEQLQTAQKVSVGAAAEARENLARARTAVGAGRNGDLEAWVARRVAELELARLNLSYTRIVAPVAGYVTRKAVEVGNNVQAGQALLTLVQLEDPWVVANYKESQLTHVEPGQKVTFTVDTYPGVTFKGRVDSIMAGTGSAFALLPPENATGNYVKVVQRIPVKILIDRDSDPQHLLRVGMSVVPTIYTGRSFGDIIGHLNPF
jgi:membrane fusion protein (multidrug efflux system)